ncbi:hypothetical protein BGZ67_000852 [Mortierella alpina]|nr:hypothetical protein BGZ67_000852 [Mortierella alpina]
MTLGQAQAAANPFAHGNGHAPPYAHGQRPGQSHDITSVPQGQGLQFPDQTQSGSSVHPHHRHSPQQHLGALFAPPRALEHQPTGSEGTSGHFFMKPLTATPDYRFNLYVKGLAPTTTTRSLFDLFTPYGDILACKTILDSDTGFCKGGFVLFDNQESCTEARRALTQQGLYVTVAHESVSIKNLPAAQHVPPKTKAVVPKIDNSDDFPSLPSKPSTKKQPHKRTQVTSSPMKSSPELESVNQPTAMSPPATQKRDLEVDDGARASTTIEDTVHHGFSALSQASNASNNTLSLGQSYLDFDGGFIGSHQQFLSEGYSHAAEYQRRPSFLEHKWGVDGIDRYMNMLELNTSAVEPQPSSNLHSARRNPSIGGAHISKTTIDDFVLEERPRRESSLYFDDLPEGLTYMKLFELCAQYGSLVLTSVDIRYINEECGGVGKVTFESHADSETAFSSLSGLNYKVRKEYVDMHSHGLGIDEYLYDQYYQQHMDFLKKGDNSTYESPEETLFHPLEGSYLSVQTSRGPLTPLRRESNDLYTLDPWSSPTSEFHALDNSLPHWQASNFVAVDDRAGTIEKPSMLGISPFPSSLSPASSSSASSALLQDWSQTSSPASSTEPVNGVGVADYDPKSEAQHNQLRTNTPVVTRDPRKRVSYSDAVKVPTTRRVGQTPETSRNVHASPPRQDLKRRGNTNKSLDEKEYRLNLYLKDLEPTMNEFRLYEICVQFGPVISCRTITTHNGVCTGLGFVMYTSNDSVNRAIEGLKELGYHAEVAIPSATNKLRCKVKSDTLFLQNIPPHIKEGKVAKSRLLLRGTCDGIRDLFRPYIILACNILRDTKSGKGRGVAFLKMNDISTAERFIEEYHGRVLGKDWKLPLQVSPAKQ